MNPWLKVKKSPPPIQSTSQKKPEGKAHPSFPPPADSAPTQYLLPTLLLTTTFHTACAIYAYVRYTSGGGQTAFALSLVGYGSLAAGGLWCLLFGVGAERVSRRTGRDKRVSGWPFGNVVAEEKRGGRRRVGGL